MISAADFELLQELVEGRLSPDQAAIIEQRLKTEGDLARTYVAMVREQVVLRRWAVATAAADSPTAPQDRPASPARAIGRRHRLASILGLAAASLFVVLGIGWYIGSHLERGPSVQLPTVPTISTPPVVVGSNAAPAAPVARLEDVQGEVYLGSETSQVRAGTGREIGPGVEIHVSGDGSSAVMRYLDGTRLELGPDTSVRLLADRPIAAGAAAGTAKRVFLTKGSVAAEVTAQPEGQPMVLTTPHAEITAAATRFSSQSSAQSTSLELDTGKAQFTRKSDGKSVEVKSGSYMVATLATTTFVPQVLPPRVTEPRLTLVEGSGPVLAIALTPDGRVLATRGWDGTVRLWDTASGDERAAPQGHQKKVTSLAFSPDGKILATASEDRTIRLWDTATGEPQATWPAHKDLRALAFSPDSKLLAGGGAGKASSEIRVWDVSTGKEVATLAGHTQAIMSLAFAPDGQTLASGSRDGTVRLWDRATRKQLALLQGHIVSVNSVAFSPDGRLLASGSQSGAIKLWDIASQMERGTFLHRGTVMSVAFLPNGKVLATGGANGTSSLWNLATGDEGAIFKGHKYMVPCIALSRDGRMLATGGWDKTVKIWDLTQIPEAPPGPNKP